MIKVLFVLPSITQANGVASFLVEYLNNMDLSKLDCTVIASDLRPSEKYKNFFKEKNIAFYFLPYIGEQGLKIYRNGLKSFFKQHHDFDIVYSNVANQSLFVFNEAKKYGIKHRVLHSHATVSSDKFIKKLRNDLIIAFTKRQATWFVACSRAAGVAMFGKKGNFKVVHNAINYNKFSFSAMNRKQIRNDLGVDDSIKIIGFVGRFTPQKNIWFFKDLAEKLSDEFKILMIGTGTLKEQFVATIEKEDLSSKFIFIDECQEVYKYYSAMDAFLLPSKYEGLPIVAVEAQANGLPCLISNTVTDECKINDNVKFLPIDNVDLWVKQLKDLERDYSKEFSKEYDISVQSTKFLELLETIYSS